jgi:oxygen-independent coproporphyrinogen III oxidase
MSSLYIHIPFCTKKCLFCSFVIAVGQAHRVDDYIDALSQEVKKYSGAKISSVYFGGGTPTFLNETQLGRLIQMVRANFICEPDAEWTIEANPEGLDPSKARFLKSIGINRVSLGVQSVNERYLRFLGRVHDRAAALRAFDELRAAGFANINVDLMFAFPGQTPEEIAHDVTTIAALGSEHVSLYSLTIEEKSRFYAEGLKLDEDSRLAEHYVLVGNLLEKAGVRQYEVSNFCRGNHQSRHNLNYWQGGDYIGLGVGAHGHERGRRSWNVSKLQEYLGRIQSKGEAVEDFEELTPLTRLMEMVVFGLRMNEGIVLKDLEQKIGLSLPSEKHERIDQFIKDGFLLNEGGRLKVSPSGRLILDELSSRLI